MRTFALTCLLSPTLAIGADSVFLSDYLGVPSGSATIAPNPPYTTIPTAAEPYGFGVDCPGSFASTPIEFQDTGILAKGIGHHPFEFGQKRIDFHLPALRVHTTRDLAVFTARVGMDAQTSIANNGAQFTVLVDGVVKSQSTVQGYLAPSVPIAVSVAGASMLSLITERAGTHFSNHACWGFAGVSLIGSPCPADLNGDRLVDDADFSIFVGAYNILDCADPAMPFGCPADINKDQFVDDTDFTLFVVPYNELICP